MSDAKEAVKTSKDILAKLRDEGKIGLTQTKVHDERTQQSIEMLKYHGQKLADFSEKYIGSAVIHFYHPVNNPESLILKSQAALDQVNEVQASLGLTDLGNKMMETYGRKVRR